ncbi:MAG TPA: winged helix DNA-binding domain-containing protein [Kribbellaceae bacterium]|nr:winged helix DNA-binding domain-containing protein [Kribbellaceae bacterium]
MTDVLEQRALNRALLARQHLLDRTSRSTLELVEHLVGMQAQAPLASYVGLWSRRHRFDPAELSDLMASRRVVRATLMRATIHLVSAADALVLRPLTQRVMSGSFNGHFSRLLDGVDVDAVVKVGQELLEQQPRTRVELRELLGARWPDWDPDAMAFAVTYLVPSVQVTPRGVWGSHGPAALTTIESWLGRPLDPAPSIDQLMLRYVAAFGPASVMDVQTWSGLTRLREVVERLPLRRYVDAQGNDLYDVEGVVLPDPDTPAPVRFLPEYDNLLLSHADRSRVIPDDRRVPLPPGNGATAGTVLVDGMFQAEWRLRENVLRVEPFRQFTPAERDDLAAEAARLAGFIAPGRDVALELPI